MLHVLKVPNQTRSSRLQSRRGIKAGERTTGRRGKDCDGGGDEVVEQVNRVRVLVVWMELGRLEWGVCWAGTCLAYMQKSGNSWGRDCMSGPIWAREGEGGPLSGRSCRLRVTQVQSNWVMRSGKVGGRVVGVWLLVQLQIPEVALLLSTICTTDCAAADVFAGQSGKRPMG